VKIRNLLTVVAMMSFLLFGIGTAYAVYGVADDVPGEDIVVPFICQVSGTMDTQWAISEVLGISTAAVVHVFNVESQFVVDLGATWTANDTVTSGCKVLVSGLSPSQVTALTTTVTENGVTDTVYAGYVIYVDVFALNQFVSWVYLNDIPNGFSAGFDAFGAENAVDAPFGFPGTIPSELNEDGNATGAPGPVPVAPVVLYPRYYFFNTNTGTFNWWIVLKGGPVDKNHILEGFICNEEENCVSLDIPVPNNLNFIDVGPIVPASIFHTTVIDDQKLSPGELTGQGGGYAILFPVTSTFPLVPFFVDEPCVTAAGFPYVDQGGVIESCIDSIIAWSYQRAATGLVISNWDTIHPVHGVRPLAVLSGQ